jgi:hypothetical protein
MFAKKGHCKKLSPIPPLPEGTLKAELMFSVQISLRSKYQCNNCAGTEFTEATMTCQLEYSQIVVLFISEN